MEQARACGCQAARGHTAGSATASWEGRLRVLRVTSQAMGRHCGTPARCGFLSYEGAKPSSGPPSGLMRAHSRSRPLVLLVMGRLG